MARRPAAVRRRQTPHTGGCSAANIHSNLRTIRVADFDKQASSRVPSQPKKLRASLSLEVQGSTHPATVKKAAPPPRPPRPSQKAVEASYYKTPRIGNKSLSRSSHSESFIPQQQQRPQPVARHVRAVSDVVVPLSLQERSQQPSRNGLEVVPPPVHRHSFSGVEPLSQTSRYQPVNPTLTRVLKAAHRHSYSGHGYVNVQPGAQSQQQAAVFPPSQAAPKKAPPPRPPAPYSSRAHKLHTVVFDDEGVDENTETYSYVEIDKPRYAVAEVLQTPASDMLYENHFSSRGIYMAVLVTDTDTSKTVLLYKQIIFPSQSAHRRYTPNSRRTLAMTTPSTCSWPLFSPHHLAPSPSPETCR